MLLRAQPYRGLRKGGAEHVREIRCVARGEGFNADRDRVVEVLCAAAGDGRLTADEFDERLEAALSSRTLDELTVVTADLTGGPDRQFWQRRRPRT